MEILSETEVLEECEKHLPGPMKITPNELKIWTYYNSATITSKSGKEYVYASRKFIPDSLKVDGKRAYYSPIIPFLIRLRELQLANLGVEEIHEVLAIELKTQKRVALCRDCGKNLGYLVESDATCVCFPCASTIVYNHK